MKLLGFSFSGLISFAFGCWVVLFFIFKIFLMCKSHLLGQLNANPARRTVNLFYVFLHLPFLEERAHVVN